MAIFKKTKEEKENPPKTPIVSESMAPSLNMTVSKAVIIRPRVTEKATEKSMNDNVYVFEVTKDATKNAVAARIKFLYKVFPLKITMTKIPTKKKFIRGKWGRTAAGKKAYVYLKHGDKIDIT
jgi:large subunit ribosomal protein L23